MFLLIPLLLMALSSSCSDRELLGLRGDAPKPTQKISLHTPTHPTRTVELTIPELEEFCEEEYTVFLHSFLRPGSLVFDIGARMGDATRLYLACDAQVVCVEQEPTCVYELNRKFFQDPRVEIEPVGLAEIPSEMESYQTVDTQNAHATAKWQAKKPLSTTEDYKCSRSVVAPVTTLDQLLYKYGVPDYCAIDVDSGDLEILRGLSRKIGILSFACEVDHLEAIQDCLCYLTSLGYEKFRLGAGFRGLFLSKEWMSSQELVEQLQDVSETHDFSEIEGLFGTLYAFP